MQYKCNVIYKGISQVSGFVGNKPAEARWLVGAAVDGDTTWWWLKSIESIFELIRYYNEQEPWVIQDGKFNHVAIHLATFPLDPIPIKITCPYCGNNRQTHFVSSTGGDYVGCEECKNVFKK